MLLFRGWAGFASYFKFRFRNNYASFASGFVLAFDPPLPPPVSVDVFPASVGGAVGILDLNRGWHGLALALWLAALWLSGSGSFVAMLFRMFAVSR